MWQDRNVYQSGYFVVDGNAGLRKYRSVKADHLTDVRILSDESSVEIFINDGEYVFSTRYYPEEPGIYIEALGAEIRVYEL